MSENFIYKTFSGLEKPVRQKLFIKDVEVNDNYVIITFVNSDDVIHYGPIYENFYCNSDESRFDVKEVKDLLEANYKSILISIVRETISRYNKSIEKQKKAINELQAKYGDSLNND